MIPLNHHIGMVVLHMPDFLGAASIKGMNRCWSIIIFARYNIYWSGKGYECGPYIEHEVKITLTHTLIYVHITYDNINIWYNVISYIVCLIMQNGHNIQSEKNGLKQNLELLLIAIPIGIIIVINSMAIFMEYSVRLLKTHQFCVQTRNKEIER